MSAIPTSYLNQLIAAFNSGNEVDRHNALMAELLLSLDSRGRRVKYNIYQFSLPANGNAPTTYLAQQILTENPNRAGLVFLNQGNASYILFDSGPVATAQCDPTLSLRALYLNGSLVPLELYNVPTNPVTMINPNGGPASGVILEGVFL